MSRCISRRNFLTLGGCIAASLALSKHHLSFAQLGGQPEPRTKRPLRQGELTDASVKAIAAAIRTKKISSVEVVQAYLDRIEEVNPWLNAVVRTTAQAALAEAANADAELSRGRVRGPLHGVPMTIKDSLNTMGVVTTWSVPARSGFVPDDDAIVVARLKAAGAILLGKTNTPELTLSFETNSPIFGPTNNPYDVDRTAGGSSGGAAAIVASSGSPFDIGSDTGGSVRVPSHCCGVAGIRPTSGRVPRTGNAIGPGGLFDSLTSIGPIARHVEDLELILRLISGPHASDPATVPMPEGPLRGVELSGLRGTFHLDNGIRSPDKDTAAAVRASVGVLEEAGVQFEEARPPGIEQTLEIFMELMNWDGGAWRAHLLQQPASQLPSEPEPDPATLLSPARIIRMIDRWDRYRTRMLTFFSPYDLLVCPVSAFPALPHGRSRDNLGGFSYTMAYSLTDWPAATVRAAASSEGLPIGVQVVARPWREDVALSAAKHIERELEGWTAPSI